MSGRVRNSPKLALENVADAFLSDTTTFFPNSDPNSEIPMGNLYVVYNDGIVETYLVRRQSYDCAHNSDAIVMMLLSDGTKNLLSSQSMMDVDVREIVDRRMSSVLDRIHNRERNATLTDAITRHLDRTVDENPERASGSLPIDIENYVRAQEDARQERERRGLVTAEARLEALDLMAASRRNLARADEMRRRLNDLGMPTEVERDERDADDPGPIGLVPAIGMSDVRAAYAASHTPATPASVDLRVTNVVPNFSPEGLTSALITGIAPNGTRFDIDFTHLPREASQGQNLEPENVHMRLHRDGTAQVSFGDYNIRSNTFEAVRRFMETYERDVRNSGLDETTYEQRAEQQRRRHEEHKLKLQKESDIRKRITEANPNMKCVCCTEKIHEPQNIIQLLGLDETEKYLEYCAKNGQVPELYCCSCFGIIENNSKMMGHYKRFIDEYLRYKEHNVKLEAQELELRREQQELHKQKLQLQLKEATMKQDLEDAKDLNLKAIIQTLGVSPKILIRKKFTAKTKNEPVHCARCLLGKAEDLVLCQGVPQGSDNDCKRWKK